MFLLEANRLKEAILREYLGMGWLFKMSLRRFGEAVFETDKTLTPFRVLKVSKRVYYEGGQFFLLALSLLFPRVQAQQSFSAASQNQCISAHQVLYEI